MIKYSKILTNGTSPYRVDTSGQELTFDLPIQYIYIDNLLNSYDAYITINDDQDNPILIFANDYIALEGISIHKIKFHTIGEYTYQAMY